MPYQSQQAAEFSVFRIALPHVYKPSHYLQVSSFVVSVAVDAVQRRSQLVIRAIGLQSERCDGATMVGRQRRVDPDVPTPTNGDYA